MTQCEELTPQQRLDPELVEPLMAVLDEHGPRGMAGIEDPVERQEAFQELMEANGTNPNGEIVAWDQLIPGSMGGSPLNVRIFRPVAAGDSMLPMIFHIHQRDKIERRAAVNIDRQRIALFRATPFRTFLQRR